MGAIHRHSIPMLPKQIEFIQSRSRETLYSGAYGAGKSRSLCYRAVARASYPGAEEALVRKTHSSLEKTTLRTLLEPDGDLPPVLPPEAIADRNKREQWIKIKNGGRIHHLGIDDPKKIGSTPLTGAGVDEAIELHEQDWIMIRGRIRVQATVPENCPWAVWDEETDRWLLQNQIYAATNPDAPTHWLGIRFGVVDENTEPSVGCQAIQTSAAENIFLRDDYLADLSTLTGSAKSRYFDGLWVGSEHTIYPDWSRGQFMRDRDIISPRQVVVGVDAGYTHPAALIVAVEDDHGNLHVPEEWVHAKRQEREVVAAAVDINDRWNPLVFAVDPAAATLRAAMEEAGLPVVKAINDVDGGIQTVRNRLSFDIKKRQKITISPTCKKLIGQMESYQERLDSQNRPTGKPLKENDDGVDGLRYACVQIDGLRSSGLVIPQYNPSRHRRNDTAVPEEWPKWRVMMPGKNWPTAVLWCCVAPEEKEREPDDESQETERGYRYIVYRELVMDTDTTPSMIAQKILEMSAGEMYEEGDGVLVPPRAMDISPSNNRSLVDEYEEAGLQCVSWPSTHADGNFAKIDLVRDLFHQDLILVSKSCSQTDRDLRLWRYPADADGQSRRGVGPESGRQCAEALVGWIAANPEYIHDQDDVPEELLEDYRESLLENGDSVGIIDVGDELLF